MNSRQPHDNHMYNSKIDLWLTILVSLSLIGGSAWLISLEGTYTIKGFAFGFALFTLTIAMPIWFVARCHYTIGSNALEIAFGPFSWSIPFHSISQITNTSELSFSPCLSLERLKIVYGSGRTILVSPKQQAQFMQELSKQLSTHRAPSINEERLYTPR